MPFFFLATWSSMCCFLAAGSVTRPFFGFFDFFGVVELPAFRASTLVANTFKDDKTSFLFLGNTCEKRHLSPREHLFWRKWWQSSRGWLLLLDRDLPLRRLRDPPLAEAEEVLLRYLRLRVLCAGVSEESEDSESDTDSELELITILLLPRRRRRDELGILER